MQTALRALRGFMRQSQEQHARGADFQDLALLHQHAAISLETRAQVAHSKMSMLSTTILVELEPVQTSRHSAWERMWR